MLLVKRYDKIVNSARQNYKIMTDFSQLFRIIYDKYSDIAKKNGASPSLYGLARLLGVSHSKTGAWEGGQWPSAKDCATIEKLLGFSLRWLVTGEGEPEGADAPTPGVAPASEGKAPPAVPQAPETAAQIAALQAENEHLKAEIVRLQDELISEQRHSLEMLREVLVVKREATTRAQGQQEPSTEVRESFVRYAVQEKASGYAAPKAPQKRKK